MFFYVDSPIDTRSRERAYIEDSVPALGGDRFQVSGQTSRDGLRNRSVLAAGFVPVEGGLSQAEARLGELLTGNWEFLHAWDLAVRKTKPRIGRFWWIRVATLL